MPEKYITRAVSIDGGASLEIDSGLPVYIWAVSVSGPVTGADIQFTESSVSGSISNIILQVSTTAQNRCATVICDYWLAEKGFRIPTLPAGTRVTVFYRIT